MVYIFGPLFFTIIVNWLKVNFSKNLGGGGGAAPAPPPPPPPSSLVSTGLYNF